MEVGAEITEIYRVHNPAKLPDVPRLLRKYAGREALLCHLIDLMMSELSREQATTLLRSQAAGAWTPAWSC